MRRKSNDLKLLLDNPRYSQQIKDILFGTLEKPKRHKFNAIKVDTKEGKFDSKLEHKYYEHLKMLQKTGEIIFFNTNTY